MPDFQPISEVIYLFFPFPQSCHSLLIVGGGGYPKNSGDSPNTRERERVLNTFKCKVRALKDCDCLSRLHKFPKI
jgi:hypothetical protein